MPETEARRLEGKSLAAKIQEQIQISISGFLSRKLERPKLLVIQTAEDPAAAWYIRQQEKLAAKLGIEFEKISFDHVLTQKDLIDHIRRAKKNGVHGIFLTMPMPEGFNADEAFMEMEPKWDVEGIHPWNLGLLVMRAARLVPPTAYAALALMESTGVEILGKRAVVVGQSTIVGRPVQMLLGERRATTTICNTGTTPHDLNKAVSESDIVVACAGQPGLVKGIWIKQGAIVIDVGTTEVGGQLVGDVNFEEARKRAGFITPVPGGVGPLTVTMLMQNLIHAYKWQKGI